MVKKEDSVGRIRADWRKPHPGSQDGSKRCRSCEHCGTLREVGVVCKNPLSEFFITELDAVCKRFQQREGK